MFSFLLGRMYLADVTYGKYATGIVHLLLAFDHVRNFFCFSRYQREIRNYNL